MTDAAACDAPAFDAPSLIICDRLAYLCARELIQHEGDEAVLTAAARADDSEARGDADQFGYWRRVETAVQILLLEDVIGTIH